MTLKAVYKLTLGNQTYSADSKSRLLSLKVHAALAIPVNLCTLILEKSTSLNLSLGTAVTIALGYQQQVIPVFTGRISRIDWGIDRVIVEATSALSDLTMTYFNSFYEKPTTGDIAKDLIQKANLKADKVDRGLTFAAYALGDTQSVYQHLKHLAQQCGFDFYANAADQVVFAASEAAQTHKLQYGKDILQSEQFEVQINVAQVEVYGESPASKGQGNQASAWLTQQEIKGSSRKGTGNTLRVVDPTARTQALAQKIAQALLEAHQQKQQGRLTVLGNPQIQLGHAIQVTRMPQAQQNGTFKVTGVMHRLSDRTGFITTIDWEEC